MILSAQQLSIHFGMRPILQQADFYLEDHDKVGIVGLNGAGKSTLLRLLAGAEEADAGQVILSAGCAVPFSPAAGHGCRCLRACPGDGRCAEQCGI